MVDTKRSDGRTSSGFTCGLSGDGWCIFMLGVNVWLVLAAWPLFFMARITVWDVLWMSLSFLPLLIGIGILKRFPTQASWLMLCIFPVGMAAVIAARSTAFNRLMYTPLLLLFGTLSLLVYGTFVSHSQLRSRPVRKSEYMPLGLLPWYKERPNHRILRWLVISLSLWGALVIVVFAPFPLGNTDLVLSWGDAADEAAILVVVVASAIAIAIVIGFLGPALLSVSDRPIASRGRMRAVIPLLILAATGVVTYFLTRQP